MKALSRLRSRGFARLSILPALAALGLVMSPPSDQIAVYAVVDRVVLAPNATSPTTIQVHGTFSIAAQEIGDNYSPATKGYLYFSLDQSKATVTRAEWADLQRVAGTRQIVGFGSKYAKPMLRVRCATEPVASPDVYHTEVGMVKAIGRGNTMTPAIDQGLKSTNPPAARCRA